MLTLQLESSIHDSTPVILLRFPYNAELLRKVKTIRNARWSQSGKAWMIPHSKNAEQKITEVFGNDVIINSSLLIRLNEDPHISKPAFVELGPEKTSAIEQFKRFMRSCRYSENTVATYSDALLTFLKFCNSKALSEISNQDLLDFNNDHILANDYSASYQNQVINAVKLFFREICRTRMDVNIIYRPRREHRLPNVLSKEEIKMLLDAPQNIKHKAMLSLIYSCGLRCGELLRLKPEHIDSNRKVIIVRQSKGRKDRIAPLSEKILELLRTYYKSFRPKIFLFEGQQEGTMYDERSLQQVLKQNIRRAGINKPVTLHWLRHSYATHLLEGGTDLRYIQEILGHSSSKTTEIYTHVSTKSIQKIISPFDTL